MLPHVYAETFFFFFPAVVFRLKWEGIGDLCPEATDCCSSWKTLNMAYRDEGKFSTLIRSKTG